MNAINHASAIRKETTLIVGGTGKTGRRVAGRLAELGHAVRAVSRGSERPFDWDRPETFAVALEGAAQAYVAYAPDLAAPGAPRHIAEFCAAAKRSGLRRVVLLSGRGEEDAEVAEAELRSSGLGWTVLRASWFAQNFSEGQLHGSVMSGEFALPGGGVAEPFIDVEDLAEAACVVLTQPGHDSRIYNLTGPRLLTLAEAARELSRASGRQVEYRAVSEEQCAKLLEQELPPELAGWLAALFSRVLDGRNASVTSDVQQLLGRPPRDFAEFAQRAAKAGAWAAAD